MNPNHYPSVELCKLLTEAGFPATENMVDFTGWIESSVDASIACYQCPSIAELLDELPRKVDSLRFFIEFIEEGVLLGYKNLYFCDGTLPNALAEMWLWLKKNNYLPSNQ